MQGELIDNQGQRITLEYITHNAWQIRKGRAKQARVWVYAKTDVAYAAEVDNTKLENTVEKDGLIVQGELIDNQGQRITLESIKQSAWQLRKGRAKKAMVWVYAKTGLAYTAEVDSTKFENTVEKNGLIMQGELIDNQGQRITLECIKQRTWKNRQGLWVLVKTTTKYDPPFDINDLQNTKEKNGLVVQGELIDNQGQRINLEYITQKVWQLRKDQAKKARVWVYAKTGVAYPIEVNSTKLENTVEKDGLIMQGELIDNQGQRITLECITQRTWQLRKDRAKQARLWVYAKTGVAYAAEVDSTKFENTVEKNGLIMQGELIDNQGQRITLEYITQSAWQLRKDQPKKAMVWVYAKTGLAYTAEVDSTKLENTVERDGLIMQGELIDNQGQRITLESITQSAWQLRKKSAATSSNLDKKIVSQSLSITHTHTANASPTFFSPINKRKASHIASEVEIIDILQRAERSGLLDELSSCQVDNYDEIEELLSKKPKYI
ncbi:hypothetical protein [Legionella gresilensis]|uniref:hypothetical protein n=1 Tax=Legionella gresilensis TaxID=91823 RepID=UPI0010419425|nr:hypothetical protein [Legionella gresilensis]